jgi:outer membrane protein
MKNLVKSIAIVALTVGSVTMANAQKIAHVSLDSLITVMPESKIAQEVAQKYLKSLESEVAAMETEFQTKYTDYMTNEATYSELVKKNKQQELQSLQQRMEDFKQQAQQDYQRQYGELSKPIYEKAKKAIEAVAKEGGYKYVLDTSAGNVLYSEPTDDILSLVKKKMDSMPAAVIPGANNAGSTAPKTNNGGAKTPPKAPGK